ncbi:hypothetical protein KUM39_02910 [Streptomyces sp. J2-1]|uniref:hypothetical protein n=1 Tax=Streptomyces corallincola TaxID=2851888 RepID=UPI001C387B0D|nr:hypothetical protein [Streptomyces corallincola]MBV2353320.1 hypothetical protein [Streptomyces corallincola]
MERYENRHVEEGETVEAGGDMGGLARAVPRRLLGFLAGLAALTPEGQEIALGTLGPGSRLVLEALRLVEPGERGGLTGPGRELSESLARGIGSGGDPAPVVPLAPRLRRIARVTAVSDFGTAAASTAERHRTVVADVEHGEREPRRRAVYALSPQWDLPFPPEAVTVEVVRTPEGFRVSQRSGAETVVVAETMEPLPYGHARPLLLANPQDRPPSDLLPDLLRLSDESDG